MPSPFSLAKYLIGWKSKRKLVAFLVDDYGNVRVSSKEARKKMTEAGLKIFNRFDTTDALETKEDLDRLFSTLSSVKDRNSRSAVFTAFSVPCNIDFERIEKENFSGYNFELLPVTFEKMAGMNPGAYEGTWDLWKEGIRGGLISPEFHGREHLNLKIFEEKLANREFDLMTSLSYRSYTSISDSHYPTIGYTAAFEFDDFSENEYLAKVVESGLDAFEQVFGLRSVHFNAPGGREHSVLHHALHKGGIKYLDTAIINRQHLGSGRYRRFINYTGKKNKLGQTYLCRNAMFEPTSNPESIDWVNFTLKQVEAAFRWNKPAIISSHRVNFCGHIDPSNRDLGLKSLKQLLSGIVAKWPDVEFVTGGGLGELITGNHHI